jgi:hypothetical protein
MQAAVREASLAVAAWRCCETCGPEPCRKGARLMRRRPPRRAERHAAAGFGFGDVQDPFWLAPFNWLAGFTAAFPDEIGVSRRYNLIPLGQNIYARAGALFLTMCARCRQAKAGRTLTRADGDCRCPRCVMKLATERSPGTRIVPCALRRAARRWSRHGDIMRGQGNTAPSPTNCVIPPPSRPIALWPKPMRRWQGSWKSPRTSEAAGRRLAAELRLRSKQVLAALMGPLFWLRTLRNPGEERPVGVLHQAREAIGRAPSMPCRLALRARPCDVRSTTMAKPKADDLRERAAALRKMARDPVPSSMAARLMEVAAILDTRAAALETECRDEAPPQSEPRLSDVLEGSVTKQMMRADGVGRQEVEGVMRKARRRRRSRQ